MKGKEVDVMNNIDELTKELNDNIFDLAYGKVKVHKEKFDDRFTILYLKNYYEGLLQNDYTVGGYFDTKDKIIYECDYTLRTILSGQNIISIKSFDELEEEFINKIENYIEKYSFQNKEELEKLGFDKYNSPDYYRAKECGPEVRRLFITTDNLEIELPKLYSKTKVTYLKDYKNRNIFIEYLSDAEKAVSKYANIIIDNNKEDLGAALLLYDDKNKFLNKIKMNYGYEFNDLYMKKKMYNSIKNIDAKKLNITIMYNKKTFTFKFDHYMLKSALANDENQAYGFGVAYDKVSEFIKQNTPDTEHNRWEEDFEFSHITSITYGKKELYKRDETIKNKKTKERER